VTVLRDLAGLVIGGWGMIHEELGGHPESTPLLIYGAMMVAPSVLATTWLARSGIASPSSPPPADSSQPSPSSTQ
jgi:hypothetical protein